MTMAAEILTADERWRRWEQRGRENDARVKLRFQRILAGVVILAGLLLAWVDIR